MIASDGKLTASIGISRDAADRLRAGVIEALLCRGTVELSPCLLSQVRANLAPFIKRGLASLDETTLAITPDGLPYARVIAAMFDSYRQRTQKRFSSAI